MDPIQPEVRTTYGCHEKKIYEDNDHKDPLEEPLCAPVSF
jgi:hypothetical protein